MPAAKLQMTTLAKSWTETICSSTKMKARCEGIFLTVRTMSEMREKSSVSSERAHRASYFLRTSTRSNATVSQNQHIKCTKLSRSRYMRYIAPLSDVRWTSLSLNDTRSLSWPVQYCCFQHFQLLKSQSTRITCF